MSERRYARSPERPRRKIISAVAAVTTMAALSSCAGAGANASGSGVGPGIAYGKLNCTSITKVDAHGNVIEHSLGHPRQITYDSDHFGLRKLPWAASTLVTFGALVENADGTTKEDHRPSPQNMWVAQNNTTGSHATTTYGYGINEELPANYAWLKQINHSYIPNPDGHVLYTMYRIEGTPDETEDAAVTLMAPMPKGTNTVPNLGKITIECEDGHPIGDSKQPITVPAEGTGDMSQFGGEAAGLPGDAFGLLSGQLIRVNS